MRPRDLVLSHLRTVGEVTDPGGLASAVLSAAIGYHGTSVAFAQLLHEMERSGLVERDVRGKRTYRIALAPAEPAGPAPATGPVPGAVSVPGAVPAGSGAPWGDYGGDIDYDELARRLLAEIVSRIAAPGDSVSGDTLALGDGTVSGDGVVPGVPADVSRTVVGLKRKLASAEERQRDLRAENARLRKLLAEAKRDLRKDEEAALLLQRLLDSRRDDDPSRRSA